MERSIITAAHAFIPGQLNMAHAAGTYIPADVLFRQSLLFTEKETRFTTGIDVHGKLSGHYLSTQAGREEEAKTEHIQKFRSDLGLLSVYPSPFIRTDDPALLPIIEFGFRNLHAAGLLEKKKSSNLYCPSCDDFKTKSEAGARNNGILQSLKAQGRRDLLETDELYCLQCESRVEVRKKEQWFLKLPRDAYLRELLERQPFKLARRQMVGVYEHDFSEWEFTRDNYPGIPMPLDPTRQLYLWCEALFAKFMHLGAPEDLPRLLAQTSFTCFFGKNIIPYYALVFPTILKYGFGVSPSFLLSVRGFCRLEQSKDLLSVKDALADYSRDELRFYCAYTVPDDVEDFTINRHQLELAKNSILINTFEKYLAKASQALAAAETAWDGTRHAEVQRQEERCLQLFQGSFVRKMLLELEQFVKTELRLLSRNNGAEHDPVRLAHAFALVYNILSCYIPERIQKFKIYATNSHGFLGPSRVQRPQHEYS
jgi:methionyl-tRNA synthetase